MSVSRSCHVCKSPLTPEKQYVCIVGGFIRTDNHLRAHSTIHFHAECFEEIAGEEYTSVVTTKDSFVNDWVPTMPHPVVKRKPERALMDPLGWAINTIVWGGLVVLVIYLGTIA